ncbi:iron-containing redox enzyme family protein [Actinokineospora terrae]|uniref:Iron-containing redox enzyme n=1 Tax=Actinokineospora terrae TaxID=155974 RepID=A0A1H9WHG2_9PSEU|nr:iron-containing redox enzyme family protein [Actinokineospora terrae]SES33189.1 Iron-containing redox enzyme [Actinokineospora terrae]
MTTAVDKDLSLLRTGDRPQRDLFLDNRSVPTAARYARIEAAEADWIVPLVADIEADTAPLATRADWVAALAVLLAEERDGAPSSRYLADEATREQFAVVVEEFAPDGLTEAQNFFPAVARLPIRAQMAVMRVMIDEFGCGNIAQAHSQLYRDLLAELDLPDELPEVLRDTNDETYAFLNSFYWLASRAVDVEYFLGALAYLEAAIPDAFAFQARACERLGIANGRYYTEHIHIDDFHMREMQTAIKEYEAARGLDPTKLLVGATLLSSLLGAAMDAAVAKAVAKTAGR